MWKSGMLRIILHRMMFVLGSIDARVESGNNMHTNIVHNQTAAVLLVSLPW